MSFSDKQQTLQQSYLQLITSQPVQSSITLPTQLLSKYLIFNKVGEGSYSQVYAGIRIKDKVPVAIKIVTHLYRDLQDCRRIYRELVLLKQLNHPNIVLLYDYYFNANDILIPHKDDELYLIMEYLPLNLTQYIEKNSQQCSLDGAQVLKIFFQILKGVEYLHSVNIIHRDLRPQNILIGLKNEVINNQILARNLCSLPRRQMFNQDIKLASQTMEYIMNKQVLKDKTNFQFQKKEKKTSKSKIINEEIDPILQLTSQMEQFSIQETKQTQCSNFTKHVSSRFYRAPEVILLQNYGFQSDIWSMGCIFAELIQLMNQSTAKGPIFQGNSCYPLSPLIEGIEEDQLDQSFVDTFDRRDQLIKILAVCGENIDSQVPFFESDAWEYLVLNLRCVQEHISLFNIYPGVPSDYIKFLQSMLNIEEKLRPLSKELLQDQIMSNYKTKLNIQSSQGPIHLKIDESSMSLDAIDMKILFLQEFSEINMNQSFRQDILNAYLLLDELLSQ